MIFRKKSNPSDENKSLHESHMKNLVILAMADGHLAEIEEHLLVSIAHRHGLDEHDIDKIKNNLDNITFVQPEKYDQRIEQFNDLLSVMAADGKIDDSEEKMCREIAKRYELMPGVVDEMLKRYQ